MAGMRAVTCHAAWAWLPLRWVRVDTLYTIYVALLEEAPRRQPPLPRVHREVRHDHVGEPMHLLAAVGARPRRPVSSWSWRWWCWSASSKPAVCGCLLQPVAERDVRCRGRRGHRVRPAHSDHHRRPIAGVPACARRDPGGTRPCPAACRRRFEGRCIANSPTTATRNGTESTSGSVTHSSARAPHASTVRSPEAQHAGKPDQRSGLPVRPPPPSPQTLLVQHLCTSRYLSKHPVNRKPRMDRELLPQTHWRLLSAQRFSRRRIRPAATFARASSCAPLSPNAEDHSWMLSSVDNAAQGSR